MVYNLLTHVGRTSDGLVVLASMDAPPELDEFRNQAKRILKSLKPNSPARCSLDTEQGYYFQCVLTTSSMSSSDFGIQLRDRIWMLFFDTSREEVSSSSRIRLPGLVATRIPSILHIG